MKKLISVFLNVIFIISVFCLPAKAEPMDSFTRNDNSGGSTSTVIAPEMYSAAEIISSVTLGLGEEDGLAGIAEICTDKDGKIYILCSGDGNSRIIRLNGDYTYDKTLTAADDSGEEVTFAGAQGLYVDDDGNIYIADTNFGRVIKTDPLGKIIQFFEVPDSSLIPDDFLFQPMKVGMDNRGYMYILSLGCYYGALSYAPDGSFIGFYGANTVNASALSTLQFIWDKLTGNDIKRSKSAKTLPYSFVDFCFDSDGYLLTCTGKTDSWNNGSGQIQKLSSTGANILYKRSIQGTASSSTGVNFVESSAISVDGTRKNQNIISIDAKDGFIYALDTTYGLVYVYDNECNLLNGFGGGIGKGESLGTFQNAVSLAVHGDNILVVDADLDTVTVFDPTDYGTLLMAAQSQYIKGDYTQSKELWEQILSMNRGNQLAYRALAMASYSEGDYEQALEYSKKGLAYTTYDLAYQELLKEKAADYFAVILIVIVLLVAAVVSVLILKKKKNFTLVKNKKFKTYLSSVFHPFDAFTAVKYNQQGSVTVATVLIFLFFVSSVVSATLSEFRFNSAADEYQIGITFLTTVGLVVLWVVSNWLICSLFSGKGTLREVYIATAYALTPVIVLTLLQTVLTYFVPYSSAGILTALGTVAVLYTGFLLCVAIMTVHEYDFFKFFSTTLGVLFLMIFIVFVIVFIILMLTLIYKFANNVFEEIAYR